MFVSFAQNFEDVLLWRALKHIDKGFYIDIGAQHPEADSVSKAFYDHGWRGVHVEPIRQYADLIRDHRPDEVVLEVALAEASGILTFYDIPQTGLSTADSTIAEGHWRQGFTVHEMTIPCIPLADIFTRYSDRDIHWVKIDVEGFELAVLEGWGDSPVRPWIVVVESTLPNTQIDTHEIWEAQLLERGYTPTFFDGLNRYYVSEQHPELQESLQYGPTVFDQFAFSPQVTHTYTVLFRQELDQERDRAQQLEAEWNAAKEQLAAIESQMVQREQTLQQKLAQEQEHIRELEKQREATTEEIGGLQIQLAQREQAATRERDRAHKERDRAEALQIKWAAAREKTEALNKRANKARREANQLSQELTSVYSSLSWKFGAPLRVGKRAAKKVIQLLRRPPAPAELPDSVNRAGAKTGSVNSNIQSVQQVESTLVADTPTASVDSPNPAVELAQASISTQQVYQRLMQARRPGHHPID